MGILNFSRRPVVILTLGILLLGCVGLISATGGKFTTADKAFYSDEKTINFVRPGLVLRILSAEIAADGTAKARVRFTDPRGLPLDRLGITTPGTIGASFILATIPKGETLYRSYTTRVQTSPITRVAATQAGADTGGSWAQVADGEYVYTFGTKAPAGYDRTATHTVSVYANRNLTEFELGINSLDATYSFVPDGSPVTVTRDIVRTATCNKCHDKLAAHGTGGRSSMENCITCHQPQTTDPDTGNTVDMATMIHRIHTGAELPSVVAGKPYQIIGNAQSMHDFSKVRFPADARNCQACHEDSSAAAQKDAWLKPSRRACGSCHDNVNFATGENHADLPQVTDNQCSTCHTVQGELEFDLSIKGAHVIPTKSAEMAGVNFELISVADGAPGKAPTVTFSIKDKTGKPILPSEMTRLTLLLNGPNTDFGAQFTEAALTAQGNNGVYFWTFSRALPATASGSYTVGIEGYRNTTLLKGTKKEVVARDIGPNKTLAFAVTDAKAVARRTVVSTAKCNACHGTLGLHGGTRNAVEDCVMCHNPANTDAARRPATAGAAQTIDFRTMIHGMHAAGANGETFTIWGGSANNFNFGYPGRLTTCTQCHVNNSEQLPLPETAAKVNNPRSFLGVMGPETASCLACHTSKAAAAHAQVNSSALGESCSTCHGPNSDFSVNKVHAQ
ncbi:MAG: OmcA/MtrC family decaheme c-type cytochrome [Bryobacterales bacterium]|nr:OmcA/MtrC family decaheme c-type cytochrome [Bryobacterales bacterium]